MRYEVTKDQLEAIHNTRHTRSPGGTAAILGISRQRVMVMLNKESYDRGFLGWCYRWRNRWGGEMTSLYVDLGAWDAEKDVFQPVDPSEWLGRRPEELLAESVRQYELMIEEHRAVGQ